MGWMADVKPQVVHRLQVSEFNITEYISKSSQVYFPISCGLSFHAVLNEQFMGYK
jgi:hypothetical protein